MKVGLHIPQVGPAATPDQIGKFARAADEAGFDGLWVFDHVVMRREQGSKYPYSANGQMGFHPTQNFLEPIALLTYLAGITQKISLGTSVLVLPMRQPVLHAKLLATLDFLSGGRLLLGAGVGWWKEEFEVLGVPFEKRGKRMDEYLQLLKALWTEEWVKFEGEFYTVDDWTCNPKPVNGWIPILLGGESKQQIERVGRFADGWHATAKSLPTLQADFAVAKAAAEKYDRDPNKLQLTLEGAGMIASEGMEQAADRLARLAAMGVNHAVCMVNPREMGQAEEIIRTFGEKHLAAVHAAG